MFILLLPEMLNHPETRDQKSTAEQKLYAAIMAKMNTRTSNIEETVRQGDVLRPHDTGVKAKNIPTRKKEDDTKSFEQSLSDNHITQKFEGNPNIFSAKNKKDITDMIATMSAKGKKAQTSKLRHLLVLLENK